MSDNTAPAPAVVFASSDPVHDFSYGKVLLISCDFLDTGIKQKKAVGQFKESFRTAQRINGSILLRYLSFKSAIGGRLFPYGRPLEIMASRL
jgi:hypothetical protein